MAAGTTYPVGTTVPSARVHAPLVLRIAGSALISLALVIALGVPLLVSGVTGFNLWQGSGKSMEPTLHAGDLVITKQVAAGDLAPGDIIMFDGGTHQVMHRIVSIHTDAQGRTTFITRGDNNNANDKPVPEEALVGKLVYEVNWLPRLPVDLSGTGLFVLEWLASVSLLTAGLVLRRFPSRKRFLLRRPLLS